MAAVAANPQAARDAVCSAFPWVGGGASASKFQSAPTKAELAQRLTPLLAKPCHCAAGSNTEGGMPRGALAAVVSVLILLLVACAATSCRASMRRQGGASSILANTLLGGVSNGAARSVTCEAVAEPPSQTSTC